MTSDKDERHLMIEKISEMYHMLTIGVDRNGRELTNMQIDTLEHYIKTAQEMLGYGEPFSVMDWFRQTAKKTPWRGKSG